jgi:hypothetical protein
MLWPTTLSDIRELDEDAEIRINDMTEGTHDA